MARNRRTTRRMGCCYSKRRRRNLIVHPNQAVDSGSDSESEMEVELRVRDLPAATEQIPVLDPIPIQLEEEVGQVQVDAEPNGPLHAQQDPNDYEGQGIEIGNQELPHVGDRPNCQESPTLPPAEKVLNAHDSSGLLNAENEADIEEPLGVEQEQPQTNAGNGGTLQELNNNSFIIPVSNDMSSSSDTDTDVDSILHPQEQRAQDSCRPRRRRGFTSNENSTAIPKASFDRLCRQIMYDYKPGCRVQKQAMEALQVAAEDYLEGLFADANKITQARKRVTLQPEDVKIALEIRGNLDLIPRTPTRIRPIRLRRLERNSL